MKLTQQIAEDNKKVFFNTDEFARPVTLNGAAMLMLDNNPQGIQQKNISVTEAQREIYLLSEGEPVSYRPGQVLKIEEPGAVNFWQVIRCKPVDGIILLVLQAKK